MKRVFRTAYLTILLSAVCLAGCGETSNGGQPVDSARQAAVETAGLARTPSPPGARVFFISPTDGETVSNPVRIEFGIEGMTVVKAGTRQPDSGHHHLLIDTGLPDLALPIPADANHRHFGDGSSSTEISFAPGRHSLRMLLADHMHVAHDPPVTSEAITITVE